MDSNVDVILELHCMLGAAASTSGSPSTFAVFNEYVSRLYRSVVGVQSKGWQIATNQIGLTADCTRLKITSWEELSIGTVHSEKAATSNWVHRIVSKQPTGEARGMVIVDVPSGHYITADGATSIRVMRIIADELRECGFRRVEFKTFDRGRYLILDSDCLPSVAELERQRKKLLNTLAEMRINKTNL